MGAPEKEEGAWPKLKKPRVAGGGGDEEKVETKHEVLNVTECNDGCITHAYAHGRTTGTHVMYDQA